MRFQPLLLSLIATVALSLPSCRTTMPQAAVAGSDLPVDSTTTADKEATPEWSTALLWARTAAEHRAAFLQTYALATAALDELVAGRETGSWAVAIDADETVLDNSQYDRELQERGESFSQETFTAWVERAAAPALPGATAFLEHVRARGGRIAVVTNRNVGECPATEENFRNEGIPFDVILCRDGESRKETRWQAVREGTTSAALPPLEIVMWLGDNIQDFPTLDQGLRKAPVEQLAPFGKSYFVFPNAMYGSFTSNPQQ